MMASRDIANMHLFLEMKKKFPELPEDILRKHIIENSDDQEKCLHLLNEEKKNHWCSNPSFADFTLPSHLLDCAENHGVVTTYDALKDSNSMSPLDNSIPSHQRQLRGGHQPRFRFSQQHRAASHMYLPNTTSNGQNPSHAGIVQFPFKPLRVPNASEADKVQSAPVVSSDKQPFSVIFKNSESSHYSGLKFHPNDNSVYNDKKQGSFSQAEEHLMTPNVKIEACGTTESQQVLENTPVKQHTVKLSIKPSFPYHLHFGDGDNLSTTALSSSSPSRHTTSVNLQLRPPSAHQHPIAVSTTPMGKRSSDNNNFDSHVQISVSSTGATFTARRLQKSPVSQFHPRMIAVSSIHQNSSQQQQQQHPNRPNVLNIPRFSSQYKSGRNYFSPESRLQRQSPSHMRQDTENVGLPIVPEIPPQGHTSPKLKPEWLHFLPSPNQLEVYQMPAFQVTASMYPSHRVPLSSLQQEINSPSDEKYKQAILNHQRDRMEMLMEELKNVREVCLQLTAEVTVMEREINEVHIPSFEEVQKLKEEIQKLRLECSCLLIEVDFSNTKQVPIGVTDEDFYSNIFTGPIGPIPPVCDERNTGSEAAGGSSETVVPKNQTPPTIFSCDDDDDERSKWKCSACTWLNHPALEICETCLLKRNTDTPKVAPQSNVENDEDERNKWMCKYCTVLNHPALEICETCDQPRRAEPRILCIQIS